MPAVHGHRAHRKTFDVALPDGTTPHVQVIRLVFENSTDFYGRVTVYDLQVIGEAEE